MSWYATGWAKRTRGHRSPGQKLVLMMLSDYYNDEKGAAWPSQSQLAEDCEIPERTVRYHLAGLEDQGFIACTQKGNQFQPSRYQLHTDVFAPSCEPAKPQQLDLSPVASAQLTEPAKPEPANTASACEPARSDIVNRQDAASEPATPRMTRVHEGTLEGTESLLIADLPEWFQTLSQDPRWKGGDPARYVASVAKAFPGIDLNLEAHAAYEWLQTAKGQRKKILRGFWTNWLKNATKRPSSNGRHGLESLPTAAELKEGWGSHGVSW